MGAGIHFVTRSVETPKVSSPWLGRRLMGAPRKESDPAAPGNLTTEKNGGKTLNYTPTLLQNKLPLDQARIFKRLSWNHPPSTAPFRGGRIRRQLSRVAGDDLAAPTAAPSQLTPSGVALSTEASFARNLSNCSFSVAAIHSAGAS